MNWVVNETNKTKLKDKRLNDRLQTLLTQLSKTPGDSIPAACQSQADTVAAYRFFDNDKIAPKQILSGHVHASLQRINAQPVVLLVQDTTQLNYVSETDKVFESGTLHRTEKDSYWLHPSVAFTPERVNLGVLGYEFWQRAETDSKNTRKHRPIEDKESMRWLRGYELACAVQAANPDCCIVSVADREADIYEWLLMAYQQPAASKAEFIIRANANRRVDNEEDDDEVDYLWQTLAQAQPLGRYVLELTRTPTRAARTAEIVVRAQSVTFRGPRRPGGALPNIDLYAVFACEENPPIGEVAVEWMLLTSLPALDFGQAQTVIGWYKARWEIELYFRTLKSGCKVEDLRLETDTRLENALTVYMIIAWHLHNMTMQAREHPDSSCEVVFARKEWRMIYALHRKIVPAQPPRLRDVVRLLAQLGGFLARKGDGEPGMKTVWRGYTRLLQALDAVVALNEIREHDICV